MTKQEAIQIFGSVKEMAESLGLTRQAIYQWPDVLETHTVDRIMGAAVRTGRCAKAQDHQTNAA